MAPMFVPQPPKPKYENTVVCPHCWGEYDPTVKWAWGWLADRHSTASNNFIRGGPVPDGACPGCGMRP